MTRRQFLRTTTAAASTLLPPLSSQVARFEPHPLDFHFHSGMEREVPMEQWLDVALAGGRRAFLMVDHLELYRPGEQGHRLDNYPISPAGRRAFLGDVQRMKQRRDALVAAIRPLAEAGLQFTAGSDDHSLASARAEYRPEVFCRECGIRPRQANGIVRELLAQRAIKGLPSNTPPAP